MEQNSQRPENGPVVVTGATGGVGSLAIDMLSGRGYEVVALTGKPEQSLYLKSIGAHRVLIRGEVDLGKRPMEKAQWAGAIDNLGGEVLTWLTRTVGYGGNIASVGLAASHELSTTVLPFILRAVCLLGINSVETPRDLRLAVWERIASDLRPRHLDTIAATTIDFAELPGAFRDFIEGTVTGRTLVRIDPR
jgi:NADPH2:quinone reductase